MCFLLESAKADQGPYSMQDHASAHYKGWLIWRVCMWLASAAACMQGHMGARLTGASQHGSNAHKRIRLRLDHPIAGGGSHLLGHRTKGRPQCRTCTVTCIHLAERAEGILLAAIAGCKYRLTPKQCFTWQHIHAVQYMVNPQ